MQQTETLKLNLIEGSDTVDPAPINENMETLETETQAIRQKVATETTAIRQKVATETTAIREEVAAEATAIRTEMATETTAIRQEAAAEATAIRQEMASMPVQHMVIGTYTGNGGTLTIALDFTPVAVLVICQALSTSSSYKCGLAVTGGTCNNGSSTTILTIVTNGFTVTNNSNATLNLSTRTYNYLAIG